MRESSTIRLIRRIELLDERLATSDDMLQQAEIATIYRPSLKFE